ncbi:MAG: hypothetical protein ACI97P_001110, partial [Arcticibacterium sp.]
ATMAFFSSFVSETYLEIKSNNKLCIVYSVSEF